MADIFAGNWGHHHTITVTDEDGAVVDISAATAKQMFFKGPSGTVITKTASFLTDGTDGKIRYTVTDGDTVDAVKGTWKIEGKVTFGDGSYASTIDDYEVKEPLA